MPRSSSPTPSSSRVGGQALQTGVLMCTPTHWAMALRMPDATIVREVHERHSALRAVARIPFLRGVIALYDALVLGVRATLRAGRLDAQASEGSEDVADLYESKLTIALLVGFGVAIMASVFYLLPMGISSLAYEYLPQSAVSFVGVEKLVKLTILLAYVTALFRSPLFDDMLRYHGAEHKAIACHEAGLDLTTENAQSCGRLHPRCGTSFLLLSVLVGFLVFLPLGILPVPLMIVSRIVGIPVIAGITYEVQRLAAAHPRARWSRALSWPGYQLQRLTTKEPGDHHVEVAIASLQAALHPARVTASESSSAPMPALARA